MNQHNHDKQHHGQHHSKNKSGLHKDWRVWVVGLMLIAMLIYVFSDDLAFWPSLNSSDTPVEGPRMPAAE